MSSDTPSADRAGFLFIGAGLVIAAIVGGVIVYLVARGTMPDGALWALGVVAGVAMLVAVYGALLVAPERAGVALTRVERTAAPFVPGLRTVAQPPESATLVQRPASGEPDALVPAHGPPAEVRAGTPPEQAADVVAQREPVRALASRDPARVAVPVRTRGEGGRFARKDDTVRLALRDIQAQLAELQAAKSPTGEG